MPVVDSEVIVLLRAWSSPTPNSQMTRTHMTSSIPSGHDIVSEGISGLKYAAPEQDDHCKAGPSGISAHPPEKNDGARLRRHRIDTSRATDQDIMVANVGFLSNA